MKAETRCRSSRGEGEKTTLRERTTRAETAAELHAEEREQRHSARKNGEGGDSLPKLQRRGSKDYSTRENGKGGDSIATTLVYYSAYHYSLN